MERPLPLPEWGCGRPALQFQTALAFEEFLGGVEDRLRLALADQPYDSVSNFLMFAQEYKSSGHTHLPEFYRDYDPPLVHGKYTCVGLAADLASRLADLEALYPGLKDAVYQVSCQEELSDPEITDISSTDTPSSSESFKEHVLLCIRILIADRAGVILLDPGYHVAKAAVVMEDRLPPQSGPIAVGTTRSDVTKSFSYYFHPHSTSYVVWEAEETRKRGGYMIARSLVHVSRPYLSGVDVTERRNLPYRFKSLLGRDSNGGFSGGLYLMIKPSDSSSSSSSSSTTVTFFHRVDGDMKFVKKSLAYFLPDEEEEKKDRQKMEEEEKKEEEREEKRQKEKKEKEEEEKEEKEEEKEDEQKEGKQDDEEEREEKREKEEKEEDEQKEGKQEHEEEREEKEEEEKEEKEEKKEGEQEDQEERGQKEEKEKEEEEKEDRKEEKEKENARHNHHNHHTTTEDEEVEDALRSISKALGRGTPDLRLALTSLALILNDPAFLSDLIDLNSALEKLGEP